MCVRTGVLYVITKFSEEDSLPNFLTHGAPLRACEELRYELPWFQAAGWSCVRHLPSWNALVSKVTLHYLYIASRFILPWNFAHLFATKQCILSSTLRHKRYLTLPYVTSLLDSFRFGTFAHGFIMLLPRNLASSKGCSLAIKSISIYSSLKLILVSRAERKVVG